MREKGWIQHRQPTTHGVYFGANFAEYLPWHFVLTPFSLSPIEKSIFFIWSIKELCHQTHGQNSSSSCLAMLTNRGVWSPQIGANNTEFILVNIAQFRTDIYHVRKGRVCWQYQTSYPGRDIAAQLRPNLLHSWGPEIRIWNTSPLK